MGKAERSSKFQTQLFNDQRSGPQFLTDTHMSNVETIPTCESDSLVILSDRCLYLCLEADIPTLHLFQNALIPDYDPPHPRNQESPAPFGLPPEIAKQKTWQIFIKEHPESHQKTHFNWVSKTF